MDEKSGRGVSRRRVLAAIGAGSVPLVAGCSGGDGGDDAEDPNGGGGDATPTETATATRTQSTEVRGTASSDVDPLSVVEYRPRIGYFGQESRTYFPVEVTVENGGDQRTDVTEYNYDVVVYDADDNDVTGSQSGTSSGEGTEMPPGERGSLVAYSSIEVEPDEVARYEVTVVCEGVVSRAEGVYCQ